MSGRDAIFGAIRRTLGPEVGTRRHAVKERLAKAPLGVIPARGQLDAKARIDLFCAMAAAVQASVERVKTRDAVPKAVAAYLRAKNLPASIRMGDDARLGAMPWSPMKSLEIKRGASDGDDETGLSHASAGIAETGTVVLTSGVDNPTTINFLPEHHIVVIDAIDIDGDLETALSGIRTRYAANEMPRTVNFITGPSRSGDIEQTLLLGAHGPRALHLIVVG